MRLLRHIGATLALCAIFCVPSHADSPQLDALAATLTGVQDTHVSCFEQTGDTAGFVILIGDGTHWTWPDHTIYLRGQDCGALQNVLTPGPRTAQWERSFDGYQTIGSAYLHLVHEATHVLLLSDDEGLVECTAYRNVYNDEKLLPLDWKLRRLVYLGADYTHHAMPTSGLYSVYRNVC
jgi:hypothetical protein